MNFLGQSTSINENKYVIELSPLRTFSSSNLFEKKEENEILRNDESITIFHKYQSTVELNKIDQKDKQSLNDRKISSSSMTFSFGNNQLSTLGNTSSNTPFTFSSTKTSSTTTIPMLFSTTMNQTKPSSVDLQLYQTMVNTQPFNNQLDFLARNIKPKVNIDRSRSSIILNRPKTNLFSSVLTKPTVLISNKRKYDDNDNNDINTITKINFKRPRMLDMNKIRSIILGNNQTYFDQSSSTLENVIEWKQEIRLPKLTRHDYYTNPTIDQLHSYYNGQGQCFVKKFTIARKHYGSVTFQGLHMNLAGLDLDRLVEIDHRQVTVYPNDKDRPNEGEELNCQAIISLIGVYPIDRSVSNSDEEITDPHRLIEMNYEKYLEKMTEKFQGHFINYDVYTGTWSFQVEHF